MRTAPPTASTKPPLPTLIYDADCGICQASVRWLLRREAASALLTEPFQASPPAMRLARLTEGDCAEAAYVVEDRPGGHPRIYRGAGAVAYTLRSLPGPRYVLWRLLGRSYFMPGLRQVEDAVYLLIARNRGRLSRACRLQQR